MPTPFHLVILGADTAIGFAVTEQAKANHLSLHAINSQDWDLTNPNQLQADLTELAPHFLVNCLQAQQSGMNKAAASALGACCSTLNIALVQVSSNEVFTYQDGNIFTEQDTPQPKTQLGQAALAVEEAIRTEHERHLLLRVGWLFSSKQDDMVSQLLSLAQSHEQLNVSDNKHLCPTSACDVAAVLLAMINQCRYANLWGTYHYCSAEPTTLFKFSEVVVAEARQYEDIQLTDIVADAGHDMNRLFSGSTPKLATKKILYTFGIAPKPWRQALSRILKKRYLSAAQSPAALPSNAS